MNQSVIKKKMAWLQIEEGNVPKVLHIWHNETQKFVPYWQHPERQPDRVGHYRHGTYSKGINTMQYLWKRGYTFEESLNAPQPPTEIEAGKPDFEGLEKLLAGNLSVQ